MAHVNDPDRWWHGGVFYQIYPRSYADSNGDGKNALAAWLSWCSVNQSFFGIL